jgi:hypothetical protein
MLQRGPEGEEAMVEAGRGRRKRAPRQIGTLNGCLCGIVVGPSTNGIDAIECKQPGCETQWVSSYNGIRTLAYQIYSIILNVYPSNRCQRDGFARLVRHLGVCGSACGSDVIFPY